MTSPQPAPFRAGRPDGEHPAVAYEGLAAHPAVNLPGVTLLADISEWQPDLADVAYLRWSQAIVIRALYGTRIDKAWYGGQRRDLLHAGGGRFLGIYAYIVAGQDPVTQARALAALLGRLRPGEKVIGDFEEGTGNQAHRRDLWAATIQAALGDEPWIYSGLNYARDHSLAPVDWVAAYGQADPPVPYKLWQFSDSFQVPGVGTCDCSVFHGSIDELAALAWQPAAHPPGKWQGEYVTAGQFSLAALAAKLGTVPAALLRMTAVHYGTFGNDLAGWLNAVHSGTRPASTPLPAGIRVWID